MKKLITVLLSALTLIVASAAVVIEKPVASECPTSFAIVIDNDTYEAVLPSLMHYRDAVEQDGLSTYIIRDSWASPDKVLEALKSLYASDSNLEGIVLVGDIPVPMVRNAQHMTTAFKMDEEKFPFVESSVPSDRFYDCLDLSFRFIKQDEEAPHLFYYELTENSPQSLVPTYYSARIRYPKMRGGDKYEEISKFFEKAAAVKEEMSHDRLDRVVSFNGHGYNSDCLIAWMDEEKAYREHFPLVFENSSGFKHWNFRMDTDMKFEIFEELERPGVDLFMFHEHGAPTTQYINGYGEANSNEDRFLYIKLGIYSMVERAVGKGTDEAIAVEALAKEYGLRPEFFKDLHNPDFIAKDSIALSNNNIEAAEMHSRVTMPRMVMFDACYNGSFHEDDYIAGEYLFNAGGTIVAQGNTRNVLQDRWTIEMIGLLSHGVRVGQYNRLVATLEGHLMGDPTVRFAPIEDSTLSVDMTLHKADGSYWWPLIESPYADVRSIALRMLADIEPEEELSPRLLQIFRTSSFNTTRMEALKLLSSYSNHDFTEAVRLGISDPYERIARMSADFAGEIGDVSLVPDVVASYIEDSERTRVHYNMGNALTLFPYDEVENAVLNYYMEHCRYKGDDEKTDVLSALRHQAEFAQERNGIIPDTLAAEAKRISAIRFVRNNPCHFEIDNYFEVIEDRNNPDKVRVAMAEALCWFKYSYRKQEIVEFCRRMISDPSLSANVAAELAQTLNCLSNRQ